MKTIKILCDTHVIPALGARKLRDLSVDDVDKWLAGKWKVLSPRSLEAVRSCLNRAIKQAMARDKVKRNVVELYSVPAERPGRPSKSLTLEQADSVLVAAEDSPVARRDLATGRSLQYGCH
ncbi:hypothetical protein DWB77_04191 [Streptomyces hundungensis]|uniref:Core-binding (CB) domain-containing protein n=1 Tax=Streptomyces hundungensis TaxID=1077946 RepID=A0A387HIF4_9ACTN|nr:hypothetical protein DWB77_04191 [Streptomyces hundungensis]